MCSSCLRDLPHTYSRTYLFKQKEIKVETNKGSADLNTREPKLFITFLLLLETSLPNFLLLLLLLLYIFYLFTRLCILKQG